MARAAASMVPPAGAGTMSLTGLSTTARLAEVLNTAAMATVSEAKRETYVMGLE